MGSFELIAAPGESWPVSLLAAAHDESRILELHGAKMVTGAFEPGGRVRIQRKDVDQALALARSLGLELPASALSLTLWDEMIARGWGDLDHSALIKLIDAGRSQS